MNFIVNQDLFAIFYRYHFAKVFTYVARTSGEFYSMIISQFFQYVVGAICKLSSKDKPIYSQSIFAWL